MKPKSKIIQILKFILKLLTPLKKRNRKIKV